MLRPDGTIIEVGYSGRVPDGINKPEMQCVKNVGPIPRGKWTIEPIRSRPDKPFFMPLTPHAETDTCGRDAFQIHGDNRTRTASIGCIVLSRAARKEIGASPDTVLEVVETSTIATPRRLARAKVYLFKGK